MRTSEQIPHLVVCKQNTGWESLCPTWGSWLLYPFHPKSALGTWSALCLLRPSIRTKECSTCHSIVFLCREKFVPCEMSAVMMVKHTAQECWQFRNVQGTKWRAVFSLTSASKFNIEPNGGIFYVRHKNGRASPNIKIAPRSSRWFDWLNMSDRYCDWVEKRAFPHWSEAYQRGNEEQISSPRLVDLRSGKVQTRKVHLTGVSGPDPDRNISPTSLVLACLAVLAGRSLVLKFSNHTVTSECGRCLVLVVVWSCYTSPQRSTCCHTLTQVSARACLESVLLSSIDWSFLVVRRGSGLPLAGEGWAPVEEFLSGNRVRAIGNDCLCYCQFDTPALEKVWMSKRVCACVCVCVTVWVTEWPFCVCACVCVCVSDCVTVWDSVCESVCVCVVCVCVHVCGCVWARVHAFVSFHFCQLLDLKQALKLNFKFSLLFFVYVIKHWLVVAPKAEKRTKMFLASSEGSWTEGWTCVRNWTFKQTRDWNCHICEVSRIGKVHAGVNVDVKCHPVGCSTPQILLFCL